MSDAKSTKRNFLVVGNWKMNGSLVANKELLGALTDGWKHSSNTDVVICPPFLYFQQIKDALAPSRFLLGAQNVSEEDQGAFTGEVSSQMLNDFDCKFVIIGHNERRRLQGETDARVLGKFKAAQRSGLIPILCVGESLIEREQGNYLEVINKQLNAVIDDVGLDCFVNAVIAYEPVWAVGTGKTASPEEADEVHRFIRKRLLHVAHQVRILYGGSVKAHNAKELFALPDIDGALLGGASLVAEEFLRICAIASES